MGVYIPNMSKPKDCDLCPFADLFGICKDNCPLIEIDIVRCKDCKWWNEIGCAIRIVDDSDKPKETDFCSFGERRADEHTD